MDICAAPAKALRLGDSNPGTVVTSPGGVVRNIAENLARLGVDCRLIAAVGADHQGDLLLNQGRQAGIGMDAVIRLDGAPTSTYVSVLDETGEMHVAVNDMSIVDALGPEHLRAHEKMLRQASVVVADTNLPGASLEYLGSALNGRPLFVDTVSAAKAPRIAPCLGAVHTLKAGRIEAEALSGLRCRTGRQLSRAARWFHGQGTQRVFLSLGEDGLYYSDGEHEGIEPAPAAGTGVANANGAGDALFAGIVYGWLERWTLSDTIRFAMSAAGLTLSHRATNNPGLSVDAIRKHIEAAHA